MKIRKYGEQAILQAILFISTIIVVLPMWWIVATSFQPKERLFQWPPNWLPALYIKNFIDVLSLTAMPRWLLNSTILSFASALAVSFLGALAAYAFARFRFKGHNALLFGVLATQMIPGLTNIIPIYLMMQALGGTNNLTAILVVYTASTLPLAIWMLNGFFAAIPIELEEAALLDGCNTFGVFWRVVMPLVLPGLASIAILTFVISWNEFVVALTFISSSTLKTYQLGLYDLLSTDAQLFARYGMMYAGAVLGLVPTFIGYMIIQKQFISGLTSGALKG